ncbi:CHAT domain-containing protein [Aquimarina muelleri]|nr:CHAT domain-containing tetratricopeptide repeat protein [Aquimarina muelleri]MCX2764391.1 CHAT domain-containing protein [Aquimarina muelleri]
MNRIPFLFSIQMVCFVMYLLSVNAVVAQDMNMASRYFSKADSLLTHRKPDNALEYFKKALVIYTQTNTREQIANCYTKLAETHNTNYNFEQALLNEEKALAIRLDIFGNTHPEVANSYTSMGHIYKNKDQFEKAMEYYQKALVIQLDTLKKGDPLIGDSYHNIGTIHHILAEYDQALQHYKKALTIRTLAFGKKHPKIADSYIDIGTTYYHLGKDNIALDYYYKALQIRTPIFGKTSPEAAFCYHHIGNVLTYLDKFDEAMAYQKKAVSIMIDTFGGDHPNTALCYKSIGIVYKYKGKYDISLLNFNKSFDITIQTFGKNHTRMTDIYTELSFIYFKKGFYKQSLSCSQKILLINTKLFNKKHSFIGRDYNNIGVIYKYTGEYDKAISYYKKAITNFVHSLGENHGAVARTYNNIANTYKAKEEYDLALPYYQKAIQIRINIVGKHHSDTSYSYLDLGDLYAQKKEYSTALFYYQKALKIHQHLYGETNYYICDTYDAIAEVYTKQKKYAIALEHLHKSIKTRLQTDGSHHPRTAKSYNQIAEVYYQIKEYKKAALYYDKAMVANTLPDKNTNNKNKIDPTDYLDTNILLVSLHGKAKILQEHYKHTNDLTELTASIHTYQKADILIHDIRQKLHTYGDKLTFAKQSKKVYADAIQAHILQYQANPQQQSLEQAFYYTEKSKANTLQGLLAESNAKNFAGLPKTILDLEKSLKAERAFYTSEIINKRSEKSVDTTMISTYENQLFDISKKQDSLTRVIETSYPKYHQLKYQNNAITVSDIQKNLSNNTTLLEFFCTDSITYAFTISTQKIAVQPLQTPKLLSNIEKLRETIITQETPKYKNSSHTLYKQLIAPIADKLVGGEIIIVPDGPLWHCNFELLLTQKDASNNPAALSYLLKDYAISYANSANVLFGLGKTNSTLKKQQECLAFSFSDTSTIDTKTMSLATLRDTKIDLPGTRREIKAIADIINGQYYFGSQAIEANFKKNAGNYTILHLALHGEVDNEQPENSKLLFTKSKDSVEDGYLYSHELFALDIPAELTVLSACNTGSGKIAKGEGIISLGTAFQYAGTKSLVLSSWEISDSTTPELMKNFYTNLKAGMNKAKALQQAKLQYLTTANINRTQPFYWGGFYLVGDTTPISFENNTTWYWIIGITILGILFFVVRWLVKTFKVFKTLKV